MSTVDWVAIAEVLTVGEAFGDDHPVPSETLKRSVPTRKKPQPAEFSGTRDEAMEVCDALVRASIARAPADWNLAMGLSGGRDSRHLLLAAESVDRPVSRIVCSEHWLRAQNAADETSARMLAERIGLPLEIAPQARDRYAAEWNKNLEVNLETTNHSWVMSFSQHLGSERPLLDGLNGGALLGRDPLTTAWVRLNGTRPPSRDEALDHARRNLVRHPRRRIKTWLNSPRLTNSVWTEAEERFTDRFQGYLDYPNPFQAWMYLERTPRGIALSPYVLMNNDRVLCPYYEDEMIAFGLSLPWAFTCEATFQEDLIRRTYPQVASVPYAHELADLDSEDLVVDAEQEHRSLASIVPHLRGHVSDQWLESWMSPADSGRGNRRMVLMAQALAWEESGRPLPL